MTTSPTYARETWIPLDAQMRSWEQPSATTVPPLPTGKVRAGTTTRGAAAAVSSSRGQTEDFADEARYSRPLRMAQATEANPREPPVIQEQHVWGVVEEWGPKAGRWGKGAKAYDGEDDASNDKQASKP